MPAISTAVALGLGAAAASGVGKKLAANSQAAGAKSAQQLEAQNQQQAVDYQKQQLEQEQQQWSPYTTAGTQGVNSLASLLKTPGQGLLQGYGDFQAPNPEDVANTPEYKFALEQGTHALDSSAAARGNLFSGTQGTALQNYGQGLASNQYQNAFSNALSTYGTNFNTFNTNQQNQYNRLAGLAGIGESATGQETGQEQQAAGNVGNILVNGAAQQAQQINNAAAARASGYRGIGDAVSSGLTYGANWLQEQPPGTPQTFGSVGGVSDPALAHPSYMPGYTPLPDNPAWNVPAPIYNYQYGPAPQF